MDVEATREAMRGLEPFADPASHSVSRGAGGFIVQVPHPENVAAVLAALDELLPLAECIARLEAQTEGNEKAYDRTWSLDLHRNDMTAGQWHYFAGAQEPNLQNKSAAGPTWQQAIAQLAAALREEGTT